MEKLKILALNPFHGGSHKSFLETWIKHSSHEFTLLTLPGTQWRWRLHFSAVDFARQIKKLYDEGNRWDAIFCTSMMNVAEFRGLTPFLSNTPLTVYFHENQLTYPESKNVKFSLDRCMANILSAYTADQVWFNSDFHKNDFLNHAVKLLKPKPDSPIEIISEIQAKASVQYQGINEAFFQEPENTFSDPVKLVWASRWEEDKNPGLLFRALRLLKERRIDFRISILGEEMKTRMPCFEEGKQEFSKEIIHFGFAASKDEYMRILKEADLFISTADHEFFGIAAVEAVAAGCIPIVPGHLAYPEVLQKYSEYFYKPQSSVSLVEVVKRLLSENPAFSNEVIKKFFWSRISQSLDAGMVKSLR